MPSYDFRTQRLFVATALGEGTVVEPTVDQANYLGNVLRLADGAALLLFNGRDGEWLASLQRPGKRVTGLRLERRVREQTAPTDLHYLFAPLKTGRLDYMIQKATEMGAGVLRPVMTQHVQMPRFNRERAEANVREAAEQCGILAVPQVGEIEKLREVLAGWAPSRTLLFCDERADERTATEILMPLRERPLALLVGPEGGFSASERDDLRAHPSVVSLSLGPRILRADTAAVAALALVQAVAGDWSRPAPPG